MSEKLFGMRVARVVRASAAFNVYDGDTNPWHANRHRGKYILVSKSRACVLLLVLLNGYCYM